MGCGHGGAVAVGPLNCCQGSEVAWCWRWARFLCAFSGCGVTAWKHFNYLMVCIHATAAEVSVRDGDGAMLMTATMVG